MPLEATARNNIDRLLQAAGWLVCDTTEANIYAARGAAIREFPLSSHGFADYLLYVDGKAADVIEAKKRRRHFQRHRNPIRQIYPRASIAAAVVLGRCANGRSMESPNRLTIMELQGLEAVA